MIRKYSTRAVEAFSLRIAATVLAVPSLAHGNAPVAADPRWNGTWREVPARSQLFVPGIFRVERALDASYRIVADDEVERCGGRTVRELACAWSGRHRFQAVRRSTGPPPATTRWRFDPAAGTLVVATRTVTPRGPLAVDWRRYRKVGRPGLAGAWRKVADGETPTVYRFALGAGQLHVATADGLLDFRSPLLGRAPTALDAHGHDHVYGTITPAHLLELSLRGTRLVGHSDLHLAPDGASFVERHVDAKGHAVSVYFMRDGSR